MGEDKAGRDDVGKGVGSMIGLNKEIDRKEVIYRLGGIDPDEGVDIYDIVPLLTKFRDLVTETALQMGCEDTISIKVRPFKEGSFITEFVVQGARDITSLFSSEEASALATALQFLGFFGGDAATIPGIVRLVRGRIGDFKKNADGTFTYGSGADAVTITEREHNALQSPKIADLYGGVAIAPIVKFDGAVQQVNIYVRDQGASDDGMSSGATFTRGNAKHFADYSRSAELIDRLESDQESSVTHGLMLIPLSGPYDGAERGYTFSDGSNGSVYRRVTIEDEAFRKRLESTEVRFAKGDVLKVDMRTIQTVAKGGSVNVRYSILRVVDYRRYSLPNQSSLDL